MFSLGLTQAADPVSESLPQETTYTRPSVQVHIFFLKVSISGIQNSMFWNTGLSDRDMGHFGPFPGRYRDRGSHTPWFPSNTISTFPYHPPCLRDFPVCTAFCPPPAQFRQPHPPNSWDPCVLTTALSCKVWKVSEGNCRGDWLSSPLLVLCWHPLKREMIGSENPNAYSYRFFSLLLLFTRWVVANSLWPRGRQPPRLLCPWDFPGKHTAVGGHGLLQGDLPDLGIKPSSPAVEGRFFTTEPPVMPKVWVGKDIMVETGGGSPAGFNFPWFRWEVLSCHLAWSVEKQFTQ